MNNKIKYNPNFDEQFKKMLLNGLDQISTAIVEESKSIVPVKTGTLRSTIQVLKTDENNNEKIKIDKL